MICICCSSKEVIKKYDKNSYHIFECVSCKFQFVHPLPTTEVIENHYNSTRVNSDIKDRIKKYIFELNNNSNNPKRDWYELILAKSKNYIKKDSMNILDIGSAYGYFIDYCNKRGHSSVGTEVTEEYANASKGLIKGEVLHLKTSEYKSYFGSKKFDFIYLEHVFEHLQDPVEMLNTIEYLLKDNGILILIVPNHKSLLARALGKFYSWTNPPDHLYFHNESSINNLAKKAGLSQLEVWTDDYYHRSIYQFYSLDFLFHGVNRVMNKLFKLKLNTKHSYKYPRRILDIVTLTPYFVLYPLVKFLNKRYNMGNELAMIFRK